MRKSSWDSSVCLEGENFYSSTLYVQLPYVVNPTAHGLHGFFSQAGTDR